MKRREFIAGLGVATAWPLPLSAQRLAMPVIGYLHPATSGAVSEIVAAFRQGLTEAGYVEGGNVAIEYRFAENQFNRLPALAADLVRRQVAVIATGGGSDAARAAKAATATIPIVFNIGNDPVQTGLVASLNRPGGNITGVTLITREIQAKRLGILRELAPNAAVIATFMNPSSVIAESNVQDLERAARSLGLQLLVLKTASESDLEAAFASLVRQGAGALFIASSPFFSPLRKQLAALAARHRVVAIYSFREYVEAGGLMSYGPSLLDSSRQAGVYVGRILTGEKPSDLPVMQPTKFELAINLKTANALNLTIPPTLLALADKVIE